jgi:hypothetical protein
MGFRLRLCAGGAREGPKLHFVAYQGSFLPMSDNEEKRARLAHRIDEARIDLK